MKQCNAVESGEGVGWREEGGRREGEGRGWRGWEGRMDRTRSEAIWWKINAEFITS